MASYAVYGSTVWNQWVTAETSTTNATSFSSSDAVWGYWVSSGTGTTTAANVWVSWNSQGTTAVPSGAYLQYQARELTAEEREALEARAREAEARAADEKRKREESEARAEKLLRDHLNAEQIRQLEQYNHFIVARGLKQYRIRRGWAGNVDELDAEGKKVAQLCIHPSTQVPTADHMLSQKLMLEHNESLFLRTANRSPVLQ